MTKIIAIDADGVLLDYREAYGRAWEKAFGVKPAIKHPEGYHATHYWDVPMLEPKEYQHFSRVGFCEEIWQTMPMLDGALEACELLQEKGYELHCVTAIKPVWKAAREYNLQTHGFKFTELHATGSETETVASPKLKALNLLKPVAFVDDFIGYMQGVSVDCWKALIDVHPHKSPNRVHMSDGQAKAIGWTTQPDSRHVSLLDFAKMWVARE